MDPLLKLVKENARESVEDLARMLDLTPEEVAIRLAAYEDEGIIRGYHAVLNEDRLEETSVTAVIEVRVQPEREGGFDTIAQRISGFPEVVSAHLMSGGYDLSLTVKGNNLHQVATFVAERLATIPGVTGTGTHFLLKTYKQHGVLMEGSHEDRRLQITP